MDRTTTLISQKRTYPGQLQHCNVIENNGKIYCQICGKNNHVFIDCCYKSDDSNDQSFSGAATHMTNNAGI